MKRHLLFFMLEAIVGLFSVSIMAQVGINTDNSLPDPSAMLDVKSTDKGLLLPRMTTAQQQSIINPMAGLVVFNIDSSNVYFFNGSSWIGMSCKCDTIFHCGSTITYGGQSYATVRIGTQCWMAENMNIGTRINGNSEQTNNNIIEKYCYDNLESNCDIYGGLYQWAEMVQYLNGATNTTSWNPVPTGNVIGICPPGWHLPSGSDWTTLIDYLGGWLIAGGKMKETGYIHWASPNSGATNSSGFSALPAGSRSNDGNTYYLGQSNYYYVISTQPDPLWAKDKRLGYGQETLYEGDTYKMIGYSVRCLKD